MNYFFQILTGFLILSSLAYAGGGKPQLSTSLTAPAGAVLAAWSQIVRPGSTPSSPPTMVVRFVVQDAGQNCANFTLRSDLHIKALIPQQRSNPDPSSFPITLCQATLPAGWSTIHLMREQQPARVWSSDGMGADISLSGPHSIGRKNQDELVMVTIGDTGCRAEKSQPHCSVNSEDWPFYQLINTAATRLDPDLVIHAGDYRYYQEGHTPDTWQYWYKDFFFAAQNLLLKSPWAFSRGNHEQCHNNWAPYWYGKGWFYFFEPTTSLETALCPEKPQEVQVDTWYFDVTVAGLDPFRFIMIDTAADFPEKTPAKTHFSQKMSSNFSAALSLAGKKSNTWWVTHRPLISLAYYNKKWHDSDNNVVMALESALEGKEPLCNPECSVNTIISGHSHLYQKIEFFNAGETSGDWVWPQTVIVGNGGVVDVEGLNISPCLYDKFPLKTASTGVVRWNTDHGFVSWRRSANTVSEKSGWSAEPYFIHGTPAEEKEATVTCEPGK